MTVIHLSTECYPIAKAGGLGDVVGALPKYLDKVGVDSWVVMPKYDLPWFRKHKMEKVHAGKVDMGSQTVEFFVWFNSDNDLGFPLYAIDIPNRYDRPGVYLDPETGHGYWDEFERNISFQLAFLTWLKSFEWQPAVVHCHDHQTAFVPFFMTKTPLFERLKSIPTVLTIHNGEYQGIYEWSKRLSFPEYKSEESGLLEWNGKLNALATAIKTAWKVSTVSSNYFKELQKSSAGLEHLIRREAAKGTGVLNGIDVEVWNPETDPLIHAPFSGQKVQPGKAKNKEYLCDLFGFQQDLPIVAFIGRFAKEKGADLLPDLIRTAIYQGALMNVIILGTGDPEITERIDELKNEHFGFVNTRFEYNEKLAHQIYAGSDFLLMPSRVEPCGLNQMYAMRYGTIPIVRAIGGLFDSVVDLDEHEGYGILFWNFTVEDATHALIRAKQLYKDQSHFLTLQQRIMHLDFSWTRSANAYKKLYQSLNK